MMKTHCGFTHLAEMAALRLPCLAEAVFALLLPLLSLVDK
jgi:hypothetical protein